MAQPNGIDSPGNIDKDITELMLDLPQDFNVIEGQWDRYYRACEGHELWAEVAAQCVRMFEGQQWTQEERMILESEGRPCITLNKIAPLVRLMMGYFRQNRYDIKYMPGHDGTGSQQVAETLSAISKHIAEHNQSDWKQAQMFQDGIQTGRGFLDIRLDFTHNMLGDVVHRLKDPFSIKIDPEAESYDPNDLEGGWGYYFDDRWVSPAEIYLQHGADAASNVLSNTGFQPLQHGNFGYWFEEGQAPDRTFGLDYFMTGNWNRGQYGHYASPFHHINRNRRLVRVLDCQHRVLKRCNYFMDLETGHETIIPEEVDRNKVARILEYSQLKGMPITVRSGIRPQIRWTITAGDRILHDDWSPYDRYTITPFFPYFRRGKTLGMVHDLLDPQKEVNRRRSAFLHILMTTANSGWMYEEGSLDDDMQAALVEQGSRPGVHVEYREGFEAPRKIEPSATPVAMKKLEEDSNNDLKEISSVNDSALGNLDRVQSGRAIQARQRQSILGTEVYFDNFSRTRELFARQELSIVQKYYNEPRILNIRGVDGSMEQHSINIRQATGEILNNITTGVYTVAIDETPISTTWMQGQFAEAMELREAGVPIPEDILVDLSSMPRKDEIKQRLEEERMIRENAVKMENLGMRGQMGIPPNVPVPPVAVDGLPPVEEVQQQGQMPIAPAGMQPPPGAPMPPPPQGQPAPQRNSGEALTALGAQQLGV